MISSPTGFSYRIESTGLRLLSTQRDDSGYYRCLADNQVGTDSESVRVRVEGKGIIKITLKLI